MNKKVVVSVIIATIAVALFFVFLASRVIVFTNAFSTYLEIDNNSGTLRIEEVYSTLNRIEEIADRQVYCPNKHGVCRAAGGTIGVQSVTERPGIFLIRLDTLENSDIWNPTANPARHKAFVETIRAAFEGEGYFVKGIGKR